MTITLDQFSRMIPTNKEASEWYSIALPLFEKYQLNTQNRIAGFMAQGAVESGEFKTLQENLKYSYTGLLKTFPRYFTVETAKASAYKPEIIANIVYNDANRTSKLGNTQPGDGWKFRGRGIFQITGRFNYTDLGKSIGKSPEDVATYLETKQGALESALWFWTTRKVYTFADKDDIVGMSKAINGGSHGLSDRTARYAANKRILDAVVIYELKSPEAIVQNRSAQRGSIGDLVKKIQSALKITADGVFGFNTAEAVRSWQRTNRHSGTGILNEAQIKQLLGEK